SRPFRITSKAGHSRLFNNAETGTLCFGRRCSVVSFRTNTRSVQICCSRQACVTTGKITFTTPITSVQDLLLRMLRRDLEKLSSEAGLESSMTEPVRGQYSIFYGSMASAFNDSL